MKASTDTVDKNTVVILDAGAQYGKVIDRRIRGLMVKSVILPLDTSVDKLKNYDAIIISGGPDDVFSPESPKPDPDLFKLDRPILGICYGMQLINQEFDGSVVKKNIREDGQFDIEVDPTTAFFEGLDKHQSVLMSHGNSVGRLAPGFRVVARSNNIVAAIADDKRRIYGVQFHPEVDLTENGIKMLSNFLFKIADLKPTYALQDKLQEALDYIKDRAGNKQVLSFASGGVDSTICAVLLGMALPTKQIHAVHVDTGFMRLNESTAVHQALTNVGINLKIVDAKDRFLRATAVLRGKKTPPLNKVTDPEIKRAIIGDTFIRVMDEVIEELRLDPSDTVLVQGTLRPDLIESASKSASAKAAVIKTHHNDSSLVRKLRDDRRVVEPLQQLHKDEVREIGESLSLPTELVWRQPFPGPGLAIRLLCATTPYKTADFKSISDRLALFGDRDIAAHLLPIRTVGVQGDGRSYSYLAGLSGQPDWPRLLAMAREIPKRIHNINRVVYIFGDKLEEDPLDITPTFLSTNALDQLRLADAKVNDVLRVYDLQKKLSQVPVISFPLNFGIDGNHSIAIRTFITNDFMTGTPALPGVHLPEEALNQMVSEVLSVPGISRVVYDLTSKPPGTTEWE